MCEPIQVSKEEVLAQIKDIQQVYNLTGEHNSKTFAELYDEAEQFLITRKARNGALPNADQLGLHSETTSSSPQSIHITNVGAGTIINNINNINKV